MEEQRDVSNPDSSELSDEDKPGDTETTTKESRVRKTRVEMERCTTNRFTSRFT